MGAAPQTGLGTPMQDRAVNADDVLDQGLPFGAGDRAFCTEDLGGPGLMAVACGGDRGVFADRALGGAGDLGVVQQGGLIVL